MASAERPSAMYVCASRTPKPRLEGNNRACFLVHLRRPTEGPELLMGRAEAVEEVGELPRRVHLPPAHGLDRRLQGLDHPPELPASLEHPGERGRSVQRVGLDVDEQARGAASAASKLFSSSSTSASM